MFTFAHDMKQITLVFKKINTLFCFVVKNIFVLHLFSFPAHYLLLLITHIPTPFQSTRFPLWGIPPNTLLFLPSLLLQFLLQLRPWILQKRLMHKLRFDQIVIIELQVKNKQIAKTESQKLVLTFGSVGGL